MAARDSAGDHVPRATYRLQLTENQGFRAVALLAPYLARLGVSHCYLSPYLKTRPHSTHGYDVIDHSRLNPELGDDADYDQMCRTLDDHGLEQLLDIVPNHIGVMGSDNRWWLDVLENGQASRFADYFDIDWQPVKPELANRVLVPVLGDHYGNVLLAGDLKLVYDQDEGELSIYYYEHRFPLDPATYPLVLEPGLAALAARQADAAELIELESVIRALKNLPPHSTQNKAQRNVRAHEQRIAKRRLKELTTGSELVAKHIDDNVAALNGTPQAKETLENLHALLERQPYRVAYWRVAADEINYRRFFDINDLAGLRTQNEDVFEATHRRLLDWVAEGRIHGFRIDHPDGLYDPRGYLEWLRRKLTETGHRDLYLIVEKILAPHEHLPEDWPVHGTTGYDFTFAVNGLFIHIPHERELDRAYQGFTRQTEPFESLLYRAKRQIVTFHLSSELTVLANLLDRLGEMRLETRDYTQSALRDALLELIACFPVYRSYIADGRHSAQDRQYIDWAVTHARKNYPTKGEGVFELIRSLLLDELPDDVTDEYRAEVRKFTGKFQQLTAPAMAKSLEDTSFYRYVKLLSLNEVGSEPTRFGLTPAAFHRQSQLRLQHWPHTMLGTSTHDSKRSEDVRARINVLSEMPEEWRAKLSKWRRLNEPRRRQVEEADAPSRNEEYLFYQTLIGTWPVPFDRGELSGYADRIESYMIKALREAKVNTSWTGPNEEYEAEVVRFVRETLTPSERNRFIDDMNEFVGGLARPGFLNGLSQTLLKLASPGVPDVYQGNELWDFSLVDPDNRRPVDYRLRQQLLSQIEEDCEVPARFGETLRDMREHIEDGRAKLYLTWRTLTFRRMHPDVFAAGSYVPLEPSGSAEAHLVAFAREHASGTVVVAVGRWFHLLERRDDRWGDTALALPAPGRWRNILTNEIVDADGGGTADVRADRLFAAFPAALLHLESG
ncbi:MAG: malto-oligosyltrehalose synthase [Gammaproteobacteria bacterium]|nr:malto-oligosyltrehalose synthase [Gammaproteobacteria bacterium]